MGNNMMKRLATTGAFLLSSLISFNLAAAAAEQTPEQLAAASVGQRQAVFKLLAFSNGALGAMARGAPFNAEVAIRGTERVAMLAAMIPEVFANNTTAVDGLTTRSSDTIWASQAEFNQLAQDLADGAAQALEILNTQGEAGVRDAVAAIGPKCGACHDRFRTE